MRKRSKGGVKALDTLFNDTTVSFERLSDLYIGR